MMEGLPVNESTSGAFMRIAIYNRLFPCVSGALCGFALVLSGCGGNSPEAESPSPAPNAAEPASAPASAAAKSGATHGLASNAGAGGFGSVADMLARAGKDSGSRPGKKSNGQAAKTGSKSEKKAEDGIGDDEAKAFFAEFDKALTSGSADGIRAAMFYPATIDKALHGIELPEREKLGFSRGIMQSFGGPGGMPAHMADRIANGERYHLVRTRKILGWPTALYRHFDAKNRMGYSEFIAGPDADGKAKILDIYEYGGDEYESDQLRRSIVSAAAKQDPAFAKTLTEEQRQYAQHEKEIEEIDRKYEDERYDEVIAGYDNLPEVLRKGRHLLGYRIGAVRKKRDLCDGLVKLFREKFPGDHGLDLFMAGYQATGDHWDEALAAIDVFDRELGGDPYLDAERANFQLQKGDFALAKKLIVRAAAVEPDDKLVKDVDKEVGDFDKDLAGGSASDGPPAPAAEAAEAKEFVAEFVKLVSAGDAGAVGKCLDAASFYRRASAGIDVPHRLRLGIEAGFRSMEIKHFASVFKFGPDDSDRGGSFSLLHLHARGDDHCAMFRHITPGGGFRYLDCVLVHDADGSVRIADYMELDMGMMASQLDAYTLAEEVRTNKVHMEDDGKSAAGNRTEQDDPKTLAGAVVKMREMLGANREQDVPAMYDKLSAEWQQEQAVMVMRLLAARHIKGDVYEKALRDYHKAFPQALNFNLLAIDFYQDRKQFDREISCIKGLNAELLASIRAEDPYLDVLSADACLFKKDLAGAKRAARKAVDADPALYRGYKILLDLSLNQRKYSETSQLLNALKKQFPKMAPNVENDPQYSGFARSPQGKLWIKQQKRST
jgi:hypothetical protein